MSKRAILVVSFGTSYKETREKTIDAIEREMEKAFPDREIRRAFTSRMIIKKLKERDGIQIDYVTDALQRLVDDGFDDVVIVPTHIMNGIEYDDVTRIAGTFSDKFKSMRISRPLLNGQKDHDEVLEALDSVYFKRYFDGNTKDTAIVLMGHGSEHFANSTYSQLQMKMFTLGYDHVYVTTVEGYPDIDDTMKIMAWHKYSKIVLIPLMIVAGDHAINDMAGDDDDSMKSRFQSAGCEVECVIEGLGEHKVFQDMFVERAKDLIEQ